MSRPVQEGINREPWGIRYCPFFAKNHQGATKEYLGGVPFQEKKGSSVLFQGEAMMRRRVKLVKGREQNYGQIPYTQ